MQSSIQTCLLTQSPVVFVQDADGAMDVDDDGCDFLLKDNGDDLDLRLERLEVSSSAV